jgi:hypothetical protein
MRGNETRAGGAGPPKTVLPVCAAVKINAGAEKARPVEAGGRVPGRILRDGH